MNSTVKHIIVTLVVVTLLVTGLIWVGYSWGKSSQYSKDLVIQTEYVHRLDSLKQILVDVSKANVNYSKKCDSLELELKVLSKKSEKLKEEYDKKISDITHYTDSELQRFFTERYSR